jgi:hypothetical protein
MDSAVRRSASVSPLILDTAAGKARSIFDDPATIVLKGPTP